MVAIPFRDDPQQIETVGDDEIGCVYGLMIAECVFCRYMLHCPVGTGWRTQLIASFTVASFYVILRFPALIETVRSQGGSQVVLIRLAYFRRLTKCRVCGGLRQCKRGRVLTDRSLRG